MAGGFSYPLSQLNRVTQSRRQPGSSFKPMTYLAALNSGLQPNTLVEDAPITYPPIGGANRYTRAEDYWSPRNYDGGYAGTMTMRRALEHSKNLATARLLDGGIADEPSRKPRRDLQARDRGAASIRNASGTIRSCSAPSRCGRSISPAFYAAIANEGKRPTPHVIEQITQDGREVYKANEELQAARLGRSGGGVPAPHAAAGRGGARHRGAPELAVGLHRRQDRHQRRVQRCLVRRLQQRRHHRGLGRLRQRQGQAHARPRPGRLARSRCRSSSRSCRRSGRNYAPQTPLPRPVARGRAPSDRAADRRAFRPAARRPRRRQRFDVRGAGGRQQQRQRRRSWNISGSTTSGRINDTQDAPDVARPRLRRHGDDDDSRNPFSRRQPFQSWFGRPAGTVRGFGYPQRQSGPCYNEAPSRTSGARRSSRRRPRTDGGDFGPADRRGF